MTHKVLKHDDHTDPIDHLALGAIFVVERREVHGATLNVLRVRHGEDETCFAIGDGTALDLAEHLKLAAEA